MNIPNLKQCNLSCNSKTCHSLKPLNNFIVSDKVTVERMAGEEFNLLALERLLELPGLQMELELSSFMGGTLSQQDSHLVRQPSTPILGAF